MASRDWSFLLIILQLAVADTAMGQEDEILEDEFALLEEELAADEVESAAKHRQSIFWSPSAITVFTRDQIQSSGATNLPDLLRRVPGFDIYDTKAATAIVGARALTDESNNLILVLVDGREEMVEAIGFPIWGALSVGMEEIERLEVIRGPGSALYGANAYSGVVNITTVIDRPATGADVKVLSGEQGQLQLFGRIRGSWGLGDGTLTFNGGVGMDRRRTTSDPEVWAVDCKMKAHGTLRYRLSDKIDVSLHGGYLIGDGYIYVFVGDLSAQNSVYYFVMAQAKIKLGEKTKLKIQLYHNKHYFDFVTRMRIWALGTWVADLMDFSLDSPSIDAQVQLDYQITDKLLLIGGGNIRYTANETEQFTPEFVEEVRGAGFLQAEWRITEEVQLVGGARLDLNSQTDTAVSPRSVIVIRTIPDHAFRVGYGLAFRKPSIAEGRLHYKMERYNPAMPEIVDLAARQFGNEDLKNEKVYSFEVGWRAKFLDEQLLVGADLFYDSYIDPIVFNTELAVTSFGTPDIPNSNIQFINEDNEYTAVGGEAEAAWRPLADWTFWTNFTLRRVANSESGELRDNEPNFRLNFGVRYLPLDGFFSDLAFHFVSKYRPLLLNPESPLDEFISMDLGNTLLLIARLGYRKSFIGNAMNFEAGLVIRAPIGEPFREYAGVPYTAALTPEPNTDFGAEVLMRMLSLYIRGTI